MRNFKIETDSGFNRVDEVSTEKLTQIREQYMVEASYNARAIEAIEEELTRRNIATAIELSEERDGEENIIPVGIYWYEEEDGTRVYDVEEMREEFEAKLKQLIED